IEEMECLPLSIQVAGRLLHVEASRGFDVTELLRELREGITLLHAHAPVSQAEVSTETVPTVTFLLARSTDRLEAETQERFAQLGAFAPKPATFDLAALRVAWGTQEPEPTGKAASSHAFGAARHWRFAGGAFTPPLTKGMLTPPWNPSIRFPALTGG